MMTNILAAQLDPSPDVVESRVGDETVLLHLKSTTYFGLDRVGTRIWELLQQRVAPAAICGLLHEELNVDLAVLEEDTRRFLLELEANDIVVRA